MFCENCIDTWLIKKQSNCPLCRVDVKISQDKLDKRATSDYCWNIIDINYNDYLKERNAVFQASLDSILKLEEYPEDSWKLICIYNLEDICYYVYFVRVIFSLSLLYLFGISG